MKATKTQVTTLRLIDGQDVPSPAPRHVVKAIMISYERGWIVAKDPNNAPEILGGYPDSVVHYKLTDAGRTQI